MLRGIVRGDCKGQEVVQDDFGSCFMMVHISWCCTQACCRGFTEMQFLQRTWPRRTYSVQTSSKQFSFCVPESAVLHGLWLRPVRQIKTVRILSLSEPHLNWLWSMWLLLEAEWFDQHASLSTEQCGSNLGFMFVDCLPLLVLAYLVRYNQQLLFSVHILFSSPFSRCLR